MSLLPSSPEVSVEENPRVVGLDSDEADALMGALSSDTAREMLSALHEEPLPPSKLSSRVDTSLQNAQYHLERLSEAGAIEVVGTAYSEKGREMDVYAPADKPLVIFAGRDEQASGIRAALRRLVGGLAALLFGAVAIQEVFGRNVGRLAPSLFGTGSGSGGDAGGAAGPSPTPTDTGAPADSPTPEATSTPPGTTSGGDVGIFGADSQSPTATRTATATPSGGGGGGAEPSGGAGGGATNDGGAQQSATSTPTDQTTISSESGNLTTSDAATAEPTATAGPSPTPGGEATATATETAQAAEAGASATPTPTPNVTATETARLAGEAAAAEPALGLPPGLVFFLGGAVVLGVAVALTYR
jgi:DNA-binding transcriptional ArsR family regulator